MPPAASTWPRFSAWSAGADSTTCTSGLAESTSCTLLPAASTTSPCGVVITPLFSTLAPIR
ncbi:hypothetical protein ASC94_09710 [Massilia sp. Root418]|nr:hypothetical protein ASC94_09710 [Massilia sp. Root418]